LKGISGFIGAPSKAMQTRVGQYVFINRRPIFSPLISKAVKLGFGTRIAEHSYPRFVLFLEVAPDSVDVNVHPQKKEARFRDEGKIFNLVQRAVESSFAPLPTFSESISFTPPPAYSFEETFPTLSFKAAEEELALTYSDRLLTIVGGYLLLQKEHLILVDLRAAHARVLYESLKYEKGASQALIWPLEIELARGEEERAERLSELGIECRILKRTLVIDALPPFLDAAHFPDFFASWQAEKKIERVAARFCRVVKRSYSMDEANLLWRQLQKCSDPLYDPLGNTIWVEMKEDKICTLFASKS
jgi:DNA mismatch repair protein MutL